jgi:hypothetical protein
VGRYQFQSPSGFIAAGSSTPRTGVASIITRRRQAHAELLHVDERERREDAEHRHHHDRRRGHHAGRGLDAVADRSEVDWPRSTASLIRLRMNTPNTISGNHAVIAPVDSKFRRSSK